MKQAINPVVKIDSLESKTGADYSKYMIPEYEKFVERRDKMIEETIKSLTPKVRGEVTEKKLKKRGVVICQCNNPFSVWVEQKGIIISKVVYL